jgi:hypothetical protein
VCATDDPHATQALVSALVNDALALLAVVADLELEAEQAEAVALLALVAAVNLGRLLVLGLARHDGAWVVA